MKNGIFITQNKYQLRSMGDQLTKQGNTKMKIKKGGGKYLLISLLAGTVTAIVCITLGAPQVAANAIPMGVSAAFMFSLKDKWMA